MLVLGTNVITCYHIYNVYMHCNVFQIKINQSLKDLNFGNMLQLHILQKTFEN